MNYWAEEQEKTKFKEKIRKNEIEYQKRLREKYNIDTLFRQKNTTTKIELPKEINKKTFWRKIMDKIKKYLRGKNMRYNNKKELIDAILVYGLEQLEYASEELLRDRETIFRIIMEYEGDYRDILEYVSEYIRNDKRFITELSYIKENYNNFRTERYSRDEYVDENDLKYEQRGRIPLENANEEQRGNKETVLAAVREDGKALKYASIELRGDKEIVLEAVEQNGLLLEYASEELREDKEIVLEAVRQNGKALKYASEEERGEKK